MTQEIDVQTDAASVTIRRATRETRIWAELALMPGAIDIRTGIGFLDHLITTLAYHAGWSLTLVCDGDLDVDDHHSAEDCAIVLGMALAELRTRRGAIQRFGSAYAPLDEALARAVVDFSGRPSAVVEARFDTPMAGKLGTQNITHFFRSLAMSAGMTLHLDCLRGENDHHKAEAMAKSLALALRQALVPAAVPAGGEMSTKGSISLTVSSPWSDSSKEGNDAGNT